nr:hypothetical protein [Tanacetum cinerariifolium]
MCAAQSYVRAALIIEFNEVIRDMKSVWELNERLVFIARRKPIGLSRFMRENSNPLQFEGPASVEKNVKRVPACS